MILSHFVTNRHILSHFVTKSLQNGCWEELSHLLSNKSEQFVILVINPDAYVTNFF